MVDDVSGDPHAAVLFSGPSLLSADTVADRAMALLEGERLSRRAVWVLLAREPAPSSNKLTRIHELSYVWPLSGAERRAVCFALTPAPPQRL